MHNNAYVKYYFTALLHSNKQNESMVKIGNERIAEICRIMQRIARSDQR